MARMTITEALADIKTIGKRVEAKVQFVGQYLLRPEQVKDPLADKGGSLAAIGSALQAIGDLETRLIRLRTAIQQVNHATTLAIEGQTRTIAEWLTWRKEVAPRQKNLLTGIRQAIDTQRKQLLAQGRQMIGAVNVDASSTRPNDVLVNVDEAELVQQTEQIETILGALDGQLSLKNATTFVEIAD